MAIRYLKQEEVNALAPVAVEDVVQALETATNELKGAVEDINDNEEEEASIEEPEAHEESEDQEAPAVKPEPVKLQKAAFSGQDNNFKNNLKKGKR